MGRDRTPRGPRRPRSDQGNHPGPADTRRRDGVRLGLATRCTPAAELEDAVQDLVDALLGSAPVAVELAKQLIDAAADGAPSRILEPLASGLAATTTDLSEGVAAFRARRTPAFQGR
jgi:enoyl-CoA hydratase